MKSLFREPLIHFMALGLILFAADHLWQNWQNKTDYTIYISPEEMQRQALIFASENRREPDERDLEALLFAHIEEQVLMREGQRLGLGENDTIIRRRLAQKMRFILNDVDSIDPPTQAQLQDFYSQNPALFTQEATRSFEHIFFSPQTRPNIEADARALLTRGLGNNWRSQGDAFIMKRRYDRAAQSDIVKDFGRNFTNQIFALETDIWSGPIESALGLHLVRIRESSPSYLPEFETIKDDIEAQWQDRARREHNQNRLKALIDQYDIVIDE